MKKMSAENIPDNLILQGNINISTRYNAFLNDFNKFFSSLDGANSFTEKHKIKIFLTVIGKDACNVFETFNLSVDDPLVSLKMVQDRFKLYIDSYKDNVVYHSCKFFNRKQLCNESFDNYFNDVCDLAGMCNFNTEDKERLLRDKVVAGLYNENVQKEIFMRGYVNLRDVIEYCRASETKTEIEDLFYDYQQNGTTANGINEDEDYAMTPNQNSMEPTYVSFNEKDGDNDFNNEEEDYEMSPNQDSIEPSKNTLFTEKDRDNSCNDLEKGEVALGSSFVNGSNQFNTTDSETSQNSGISNNLLEGKGVKLEIETDLHEEKRSSFNDGDIEIDETGNSQGNSIEIITVDSSDSDEDEEQTNNNENNVPNHIRTAKRKHPTHYRQTALNFPKVKNSACNKKLVQPYLCDKRFKWVLTEPHQTDHVIEKPFACPFCNGSKFSSKNTLHSHLRNVHRVKDFDFKKKFLENNNESAGFKCPKCPKKYDYKRSLSRHMTLKHSKGDSDTDTDSDPDWEPKLEPKEEISKIKEQMNFEA